MTVLVLNGKITPHGPSRKTNALSCEGSGQEVAHDYIGDYLKTAKVRP